MPIVTVGDARVPYRVDGTGPALVLVHGTGPDADIAYGRHVPRFAAAHTVLVPDLSGTGPAQDTGAALTVEMLADQVLAVIADAGVERVDIVGFSLGSPVAIAVAAARPDLVRRLVVMAGWVSAAHDEYLRNMFTVWRRLADLDAEAFGRYSTLTGFSPGFLNAIGHDEVEGLVPHLRPTPGLIRQIELCLSLDITDLLPDVTAETLVVGCALDITVPPAHSRRIHEAVRGSTYTEIESGHVVLLEQPDRFVEVVERFTRAA